jgi:hypothetical protein
LTPTEASSLVFSQSNGHSWLFSRFFVIFYSILFHIRTKWHQLKLPSLYLAKVMAIYNYEIWVLQYFCSKNFKISKFWICHFLTIVKNHLLLEHINSLNLSLLMLLMLSVKSVFKKNNWWRIIISILKLHFPLCKSHEMLSISSFKG